MDLWGEDFNFTLQVSSCGAERELRLPEDLDRFQGLLAKLEVRGESGNWEKLVYRLGPRQDEMIELTPFDRKSAKKKTAKPIQLSLGEIRKGNLFLEY
ncbi:ribosome maturation factor RimP [Leptospira ryugenii]|uniref:Ribosome maturation factor RimP n=1 Tax=Leptospira ryugenii TaxID=1917863 RepID=A0A2P2DXD4_9LEPT|nr:ribosome maturation factor RimP [Leptospira ryugenii]